MKQPAGHPARNATTATPMTPVSEPWPGQTNDTWVVCGAPVPWVTVVADRLVLLQRALPAARALSGNPSHKAKRAFTPALPAAARFRPLGVADSTGLSSESLCGPSQLWIPRGTTTIKAARPRNGGTDVPIAVPRILAVVATEPLMRGIPRLLRSVIVGRWRALVRAGTPARQERCASLRDQPGGWLLTRGALRPWAG